MGRRSYFTPEGKVALMFLKMHKRLFGVEAKKVGEEGKRHCQKGTCPGAGDSDGGLVRHTERALRPKAGQGPDEADGNLVHLLRHPHGKRGAAGRQNRAEQRVHLAAS